MDNDCRQDSPAIISFDGLEVKDAGLPSRCKQPADVEQYELFKNSTRMIAERLLSRVTFVESRERRCLRGNLLAALGHVRTRFVNIMHHDLPIVKPIATHDILQLLGFSEWSLPSPVFLVNYVVGSNADQRRRLQHICMPDNTLNNLVFYGTTTISPSLSYSDTNHFSTLRFYTDTVMPSSEGFDFMEWACQCKPATSPSLWGAYYLGDVKDGH